MVLVNKFEMQCPYKTALSVSLVDHMQRKHTLVNNHGCDECAVRFLNKRTLFNHVKIIHLKIKDFKCAKYARLFGTKYLLNSHIKRVHLKIKDNECDSCDAAFATTSDLKTPQGCSYFI